MSRSNIGWTEETWNPVTGCSHVSEGCRHCYAEMLSLRRGWSEKPWTAPNAAANVRLHHSRLPAPLHWKKPRLVFVNSMSDLFHELVPDEFIDRVFAVMALSWRHTFQVLTKRAERMRDYMATCQPRALADIGVEMALAEWGPVLSGRDHYWRAKNEANVRSSFDPWPLPNVWLGVSVEDQKNADERIPVLQQTPGAMRFLSCEPLLGPIFLPSLLTGIGWVIAGGESGPNYRAMEKWWAEEIRNACRDAGVPFFMKQDSGPRPGMQGRIPDELWVQEMPERQAVTA